MARKGILAKITGDQLSPVNPAGGAPVRTPAPHGGFAGRGAFGAVSRSIDDLAAKAEAAREIEERLTAGETVVDLDPDKITSSFIADRFAVQDDDEDFQALVEAIKARGQDSPILVRPHPDHAGQFQIAFGHRRVRAAQALGRQVRAVIKNLSDRDHLLAQGQENSARANLSFIERALYARRLEEHGFDREMIMSALTVDKTLLSRMISITHHVPIDIIISIGPAPSAGRPRWTELANAMQVQGAAENAERFVDTDAFKEGKSDQRFESLLAHLLTQCDEAVTARAAQGRGAKQSWSTPEGVKLVSASGNERSYILAIDRKAAPDFGAFVLSQMDRLFADYSTQRKEDEAS